MQERWQNMKMRILQGRASIQQEVSCTWRRRLVLLSGPYVVRKNVGGEVDSGLRVPFVLPLTCFNARACLFRILGRVTNTSLRIWSYVLLCSSGLIYYSVSDYY